MLYNYFFKEESCTIFSDWGTLIWKIDGSWDVSGMLAITEKNGQGLGRGSKEDSLVKIRKFLRGGGR